MKKILLIALTVIVTVLIIWQCNKKSPTEFSEENLIEMESNLKVLESYPRMEFPETITVGEITLSRIYMTDSEAEYASPPCRLNLQPYAQALSKTLDKELTPRYTGNLSILKAFKYNMLNLTIRDKILYERDKVINTRKALNKADKDGNLIVSLNFGDEKSEDENSSSSH
jgi:hypothetical protein